MPNDMHPRCVDLLVLASACCRWRQRACEQTHAHLEYSGVPSLMTNRWSFPEPTHKKLACWEISWHWLCSLLCLCGPFNKLNRQASDGWVQWEPLRNRLVGVNSVLLRCMTRHKTTAAAAAMLAVPLVVGCLLPSPSTSLGWPIRCCRPSAGALQWAASCIRSASRRMRRSQWC